MLGNAQPGRLPVSYNSRAVAKRLAEPAMGDLAEFSLVCKEIGLLLPSLETKGYNLYSHLVLPHLNMNLWGYREE